MYNQLIREALAKQGRIGVEPRHVEAFMRLEFGTLDGVCNWDRAVREAADGVVAAGPGLSEELALSYGLRAR